MSWSLPKLIDHLEASGSDELTINAAGSVYRMLALYRYHVVEARDWSQGVFNSREPTPEEAAEVIFGISSKQSEYQLGKLKHEANFAACVATTRNVWEHFAQLVNALVLGNRLSEKDCSIFRVRDSLSTSKLKTHIDISLSSREFLYVSDFYNTSKHRYLVQHKFSHAPPTGESDIRLEAFEYHDRRHPKKWGKDALEEVNRVWEALVEAGCILNSSIGIPR